MSSRLPRILLYVLSRDVRLSDNPAFHAAALNAARPNSSRNSSNGDRRHRDDSLTSEHGGASFTHLLPVYVFPPNQIEVSGFLSSPTDKSPYPEARSDVAKVWRTGPHRVQFIADGVWDLKEKIAALNCDSGLEMRVGRTTDVVSDILDWYSKQQHEGKISGIWMTEDDTTEERRELASVKKLAEQHGVDFKAWKDEKYYIDE
jgi:deoxyribodipyrimidine photo-lyase